MYLNGGYVCIFFALRTLLEIDRYMPVYHTGIFVVSEFHTGTYQYLLYTYIFFHFSDSISLFRF
jgi:hypothetical protein